MERRPVVLTFVRHYLPGFRSGGPVRSISNLVEKTAGKLVFRIVTSDRDLGDVDPYPGVSVDHWQPVGDARVFYAKRSTLSPSGIARLIRETPHDILYLNSVFDPLFAALPLLARRVGAVPHKPVVVASRGELSEGALALKHRKKGLYLRAARTLGLFQGVTWQASSEHEARDIARYIPGARIRIAPNLLSAIRFATPPGTEKESRSDTGSLKVAFLSRISPKKNLDYALRVVRRVRVPIQFDVYGPAEDPRYWSVCKALMRAIPDHVAVRYLGPVAHGDVPRVLASYDVLFLPTRSENFGYVIAEALAAGTPVLISDTTPWRDLETQGLGWDLPLDDEEAFARKLEELAGCDRAARDGARRRIQEAFRGMLDDPAPLEANLRLFLEFSQSREAAAQT